MYSKLKSVLRTFLFFSIIFWALSSGNPLAKAVTKEEPPTTQKAQPAKIKKESPQVHAGKNETSTLKEKAVDKAGERIGQKIDQLSRSASSRIGEWIEVEIFAGITWLKLLFCLFLTLLVVMVERLLRWLIN